MRKTKCSVKECPSPPYCKGLCPKHYHRARRHDGDPGEAASRHRSRVVVKTRVVQSIQERLASIAEKRGITVSRVCEELIELALKKRL